jgi:pyruvate formate lyase activating enzyme
MHEFPELTCCTLCEHRCGVDRLAGELGVCRVAGPAVASAQLHPAPPSSYTVFMAGCNFKCLNCQNWTISCYPDRHAGVRGWVEPIDLAEECVGVLGTDTARSIAADRVFFSGGAPDIHLPYIEEVVRQARLLEPSTRVNFDTNGSLTEPNFDRVLALATSVTFDIKAIGDEVHLALTGASVRPVLRNAEKIGMDHPNKLWEYRILVIPDVTDQEIADLCDFIAAIDPELPVSFLAFRPNYVMERHRGASLQLMEWCLSVARSKGLRNAHWAGLTDIAGEAGVPDPSLEQHYGAPAAHVAATYARAAGCVTHPRDCAVCHSQCGMREHVPARAC